MEDDATPRAEALARGRALLGSAPWVSVSDRVTLLLVGPPSGLDAGAPLPDRASFWLTLDRASGRSLPAPYGAAFAEDRALVEQSGGTGGPRVMLSVLSDDALHRLLEGTTRPSLEARWLARHHEVVVDRLRRGEQYATRAGLLPEDAPERIVRTLFLEAVWAVRGIETLESAPVGGMAAAGEASGALCRLACFDDSGAYPPVAYLRAASGETRLGRRIGPWLDDLARAVGGDPAAARRSIASGEQVIEEARTILGERYRNRPWLRSPEAFALRVPR